MKEVSGKYYQEIFQEKNSQMHFVLFLGLIDSLILDLIKNNKLLRDYILIKIILMSLEKLINWKNLKKIKKYLIKERN